MIRTREPILIPTTQVALLALLIGIGIGWNTGEQNGIEIGSTTSLNFYRDCLDAGGEFSVKQAGNSASCKKQVKWEEMYPND